MGRISEEEAKNYSNSQGSWFQLKNDKDFATVQFLIDSTDDLAPYVCHRVKIGDKERYVDCLATYGEECPLCHANYNQKLVRFLSMYQHEDKTVKVWERGKKFIQTVQGYMNRYNPITDYVFQIERNGKAGSKETTYQIYPMADKPLDVSEVERPTILGGIILQKDAQELEEFLQTGRFPSKDEDNNEELPPRRQASEPEIAPRPSRRDVPVSDRSVF